jgi:hypothetical protein
MIVVWKYRFGIRTCSSTNSDHGRNSYQLVPMVAARILGVTVVGVTYQPNSYL